MENILVTGGAGYIGSKICYDLIDKGFEVVIVDNLTTGHKKLINKNCVFYKVNIGDKKSLFKIFKKHNIDKVIHMAASLSVQESMIKPQKYYLNNVYNTKKLLDVCAKFKIKKFVFSSTCAVYGEKKKRVKSNDTPSPSSYYGLTKLLCEKLIETYAKKYNFSYFILRYFNVVGADYKLRVGPINRSGQLFKNLSISILKKNKKINIYGKNYNTKDGTCIRDYIDVNDLSNIHINCLKKILNKKSLVVNCGYGKGHSVLEVINHFENISGKKYTKEFKKPRKGDISEIICSPSKNKYNKIILTNNYNIKDSIKSSLKWEFKIKNMNRLK